MKVDYDHLFGIVSLSVEAFADCSRSFHDLICQRRTLLRILSWASTVIFLLPHPSWAQGTTQDIMAPSTITGPTAYSTLMSSTESLNNANGNVSVSIPLLHLPGINGFDLDLSVSYASKGAQLSSYQIGQNLQRKPIKTIAWTSPRSYEINFAGGRLSIPRLTVGGVSDPLFSTPDYPNVICNEVWVLTDGAGAPHSFANVESCEDSDPSFPPTLVHAADATDGSFARLDTSNLSDVKAYLKNGDVVHFNVGSQTVGTIPSVYLHLYPTAITDPNGNSITFAQNSGTISITDTLGRNVTVNSSANTITYYAGTNQIETISASSTSATTPDITMTGTGCLTTTSSVVYTNGSTVSADFGTAGTSTQITIPSESGNRTYVLTLDSLGGVSKVVYPSGGYTRYTYSNLTGHGTYCSAYSVREVDHKYSCTSSSGSCSSEAVTQYIPVMASVKDTNSTMTIIDPPDVNSHQRKSVFTYSALDGSADSVPDETSRAIYDNQITLLSSVQTSYFNNLPGTPTTCSSSGTIYRWSLPCSVTSTAYGTGGSASTTTTYSYNSVSLFGSVDGATGTYTMFINNPNTIAETDFSNNVIRTTSYSWQTGGNYSIAQGHILDRMASKTVSGGGVSSSVTYGYDTIGNRTSATVGGTNAPNLTTGYSINSYGQVTKVVDPKVITAAQYAYANAWYDSACPVISNTANGPSSYTDALGHVWTYHYYSCSGLLAEVTDPNGQSTIYTYDQLFRVTRILNPDGGSSTFTYADTVPNSVLATTAIAANGTPGPKKVLTLLDGLGRTVQTQLQSDPSGIDYTDTAYDDLGRTVSVSNPYRSTSDPTYGVTSFSYDALDRPIGQTDADGLGSTESWAYSANTLTFTDELGQQWKRTTDALGRLVQVLEPNGSTKTPTLETDYSYDVLGDLTCVEQHGGVSGTGCSADPSNDASSPWRIRRFMYDGLSHLLSAKNPESRTVSYTYDADGNVQTKTDARGIQITYAYDNGNRITGKTFFNGEAAVSYSYDASGPSNFGIGHRTGMTDGSGSTNWTYDTMGRAWTESKTIGTVNKSISTQYYLDGSAWELTYPSGTVVEYTPDSAGRTIAVVDDTHSVQYISNVMYTPSGAVSSLNLGSSGMTIANQYNKRLQPAVVSSAIAAGTITSFTYDFHSGTGDNGNLYGIINNKDSSRTESFNYDTLNRVNQAQAGSTWGIAFTTDAWGNLYQTGTVAGTSVLPMPVNQAPNYANQFTLLGYNYDLSGNAISDGLNSGCGSYSYTWTAEGLASCSAGTSYIYDGDGNRVKKSGGLSAPVLYFAGDGAMAVTDLSGTNISEYIFFNGDRIARRDGNGSVHFYHPDMLGSVRVVTDVSGVIEKETDYTPYGGEWTIAQNATTPNFEFTGKERDTESGNDYFGARYYASTMGRFLSPDPSGLTYAVAANPQSLNLYSYALNNPLKFIDPTGMYCFYGGAGDTPENDSDPTDYDFTDERGDCGGQWIDNPSSTVTVSAGGDNGNTLSTFPSDVSQNFQFIPGKGCAAALKTAGANGSAINNYYNNYQAPINNAANSNGVDPNLLAAVGVRESGLPANPDVVQANGNGRGLFQIDLGGNPNVSTAQAFDPTFSANFAANMLSSNMSFLANAHPNFNGVQLAQATAATYNMGLGNHPVGKNISGNPNTIDVGTTGGNYGSNVVAISVDCF